MQGEIRPAEGTPAAPGEAQATGEAGGGGLSAAEALRILDGVEEGVPRATTGGRRARERDW